MPELRAHGAGGVRLRLDGLEADLLRNLVDQLEQLVGLRPDDPVTGRLFPDAFDAPGPARAYRELVGDSLEREKLDALAAVRRDLGPRGGTDVHLDPDGADSWLRVLTDLRLAIGTRLDVDEARLEREPDPSDPEGEALAVLHWLGWVQESMLRVLGPPA